MEEEKREAKEKKNTGDEIVLMCFDFISYRMGNSVESDIYFGSSKGTISLYTTHKHFFMKEKAHLGSINCIRITDIFNQTVCVMTVGEDGFLKIWSP